MNKFVCPNCNSDITVVKGLTACPECGLDLRRRIAQAKQTLRQQSETLNRKTDEELPKFEETLRATESQTPQLDDQLLDFDFEDDSKDFADLEAGLDDSSDAKDHSDKNAPSSATQTLDYLGGQELPLQPGVANFPGGEDPNVDPMKTLSAPSPDDTIKTLAVPNRRPDVSNKTLGVSDKTLGDSDATMRVASPKPNDDQDTNNQPPQSTDPTLIVPQTAQEPTIVNPVAAQEAAEQFSLGLKSIIPPRTLSRDDLPGQIQDYKVEKRLGAGAFGIVFKANQVPLERSVAIKVLTQTEDASEARSLKLKNEFLREAQFTGRLEHPNIVPIHDIGLTVSPNGETNPFYVMKEIRGVSWLSTIREKSRRENLKIFKNVVNAIGFAHDQNIIHCDLKPENVMVGEFGEVLVVDWGQAIDLASEETMRPGGTPAYISPEMAQYWCDIHLDHKQSSPSRDLVGLRTDVYLLGALLFEIVTGVAPHTYEGEESPYQIIRRAAVNEIAPYEKHAIDELTQIALGCMRLGDREPIETVDALTNAISKYENRLSSIELRQRAYEILAQAKNNSDYDEFQRARFSFEESLQKWPGNARSKRGLRDAQVSCAQLALKDQNYDLGIGMLDEPQSPEETSLKEQLVSGKLKRDRRKKLVRYLALGLASSILVGIVANLYMTNENMKLLALRAKAVAEKIDAENDKAEAEKAKIIIEQEKSKLEIEKEEIEAEKLAAEKEVIPLRNEIENKNKEIAAFPEKLANEQKKFSVELAKKKQGFDKKLAEEKQSLDQKLEAEKKSLDFKLAKEKEIYEDKLEEENKKFVAETAQLVESSKFIRYKSIVTNIGQKAQSGDYRETRTLLDGLEDKSNWEVARLNLLAHREIDAIYPKEPLESMAASADGTTFGLLFPNRIDIRKTKTFNRIRLSIPLEGVTAIAFSKDGNRLALGKPAESQFDPGKIWIVDISNPTAPRTIRELDAQSRSISKMQFSNSSDQFLSVGAPSKLRKSSNTKGEEELMVWNRNWELLKVKLVTATGDAPNFSDAQFSENGNRILTTDPTAQPRDQLVHVFQKQGDEFRWVLVSPNTGINAATFANAEGTAIIGCAMDNQSGTYSLVDWQIDQTQYVNASSTQGSQRGSIRSITQLSAKALSIIKYGNQLVTSGMDRKATIWDWRTKTPTPFAGHSRDVNLGFLLLGQSFNKNVLISGSIGESAEILKTDLSTFKTEIVPAVAGRLSNNDQPSPTTITQSESGLTALGNNLGQASVIGNGKTIQWVLTAWKNHVISNEYIYAQSRGDYIYRFNRETGALDRVLTNLANSFTEELVKFEVSQKNDKALVVTAGNSPQLHIWDLKSDKKIRTINYGAEDVFGTGTEKELLAFSISPDGRWIIAGKVGVFAWSTETGQRKQLTIPGPEMARSAISSIKFINDGTRFLVSWRDRIDLFDLNGNSVGTRFNTSQIPYNKNESNVLDAREQGGKVYVLARSIASADRESGITLMDLETQTELAVFEGARFASFSQDGSGNVVVVNNSNRLSKANSLKAILQKWDADSRTMENLKVDEALSNRFDNRFSVIQKAYEANGSFTLQTSTKNKSSSTQRDWNTISVNQDLTPGPIRIVAKPYVQYHAVAQDRSITLDSGALRLWKLYESSVQPDGIIAGDYRCCALSQDQQTLAAVPFNSKKVIAFDPKSGQQTGSFVSEANSTISSIAWSSDSNQLAIGFDNGVIEFAKLEAGQLRPTGQVQIAETTISEIRHSKSNSTLAFSKQAGKAFVIRQSGQQWHSFTIQHVDGKKIVTGDIDDSGLRVVTGSAEGRLTLWNSESSVASVNGSNESVEERELYNFKNRHQSSIEFARFHKNANGETEVVSSESNSGKNKYLIWKTKPLE